MMQQDKPDDYVIATGESHTVQEFLELVFERLKLDWRKHVVSDPRYLRPSEVDILIGDYSKARNVLKWEPKLKFPELVELMVNADMELAERERRSLGR